MFCWNIIIFPVLSSPSQLACIFIGALKGLGALQAARLGQGGAGQAGDKHGGAEGDGEPCGGLYYSRMWLLAMDKSLCTSALAHQLGGKGVGNNTGTVP